MKFTDNQTQILNNAISAYGVQEQRQMAIGEIGELLTLFGREAQGRASNEDWQTEIADVIIMIEQLARMYGYEEIQSILNKKLNRLNDRINNFLETNNTNI